ncbi:unnamed protein product [Xylocopa violacea]|uniref:Uncharacterized protein n=1 Tax=Xylocopa violacea TaxID=135666 RepID=A0ABP1NL33_XYLVO
MRVTESERTFHHIGMRVAKSEYTYECVQQTNKQTKKKKTEKQKKMKKEPNRREMPFLTPTPPTHPTPNSHPFESLLHKREEGKHLAPLKFFSTFSLRSVELFSSTISLLSLPFHFRSFVYTWLRHFLCTHKVRDRDRVRQGCGNTRCLIRRAMAFAKPRESLPSRRRPEDGVCRENAWSIASLAIDRTESVVPRYDRNARSRDERRNDDRRGRLVRRRDDRCRRRGMRSIDDRGRSSSKRFGDKRASFHRSPHKSDELFRDQFTLAPTNVQ